MIEKTAEQFFAPELLKVFETLPTDELNTKIDEQFVPAAQPVSADLILQQQETIHSEYRKLLLERCFRAWPAPIQLPEPATEPTVEHGTDTQVKSFELSGGQAKSTRLAIVEFESEPFVNLQLEILHNSSQSLDELKAINLLVGFKPSPLAQIGRAHV